MTNAAERADLDGFRLMEVGGSDVWLIFHGRRHRIASPAVYDSLFSGTDAILFNADIAAIPEGPELNEGTCLVRPAGDLAVYLATGGGDQARLLHVQTYETMLDFGFEEDKVQTVPRLIIDAMRLGDPLESAPDRASRQG